MKTNGLFSGFFLSCCCIFCQWTSIVCATTTPAAAQDNEDINVRIRRRDSVRSLSPRVLSLSSEDPMAVSLNPRHFYWLLQKYGTGIISKNLLLSSSNADTTINDSSQLRWDSQQQQQQQTTTTSNVSFVAAALSDSLMSSFAAATATEQSNSSERDEFLQECRAYILSDQVLGDGLISQVDTTNFLIDFCIKAQVCEPGYEIEFQALDFRLQLSFTRFNCPFRNDGPQDEECLDNLGAQGNDEFGYVLSLPTPTVEEMMILIDRLGGYCAWLWYFGSDFHGVSFEERGPSSSPVPSFAPSTTGLPTQSSVPTQTVAPSSSPTVAVAFPIDFTYIVGFDNETITAQTLDDGNQDVVIMDDVRGTIRRVLAWYDVTRRRRRLLRQPQSQRRLQQEGWWIGFRSDGSAGEPEYSQIHHKHVVDENACPTSFLQSKSCVRVVTEVVVYANPDYHNDTTVNIKIQSSIQNSMNGDLFLDSMERTEIKEVMYVSAGSVLEDGSENSLVGDDRGVLSEGGVAGIAVGALFLAAIIGLFVFSRSRSEDDRSLVVNSRGGDSPSSDDSYSLQEEDAEIGMSTTMKGDDNKRSLKSVVNDADTMDVDKAGISRATQLDTVTGAVIPAAVSSRSSASASILSSRYSDSEKEDGIWIGRLDAAVSAGDWAEVANIAGELSTADEASTESSMNTRKLNISSDRESMLEVDDKRSTSIDKLIAGDWNAVGATAAALDDASHSAGSEVSNDLKNSKIVAGDNVKKRSIIDFIAGPWQSSAVSKAIIQDAPESDVEDVNISAQSDAVSSLSGGHSPERRPTTRDLEPTKVAPALRQQRHSSASSTSSTEEARVVGERSDKKGWKNRIPSLRRKNMSTEKAAAKSLALQEDSSVSSWSHGSPESQVFVPYSSVAPNVNDAPQELKAFGEDFGLVAAEHDMLAEEKGKVNTEDDEDVISQQSSNSLRDELDKAIEKGDWEAVEAQTNAMFDAVDVDNSLSIKPSPNSSREYSDDVESREGWSTNSSKSGVSSNSEPIDDERIYMLEKLIETDDWQGIINDSRIHSLKDDDYSSMVSSVNEEASEGDNESYFTVSTGPAQANEQRLDEDLSLASSNVNTGI